MEVKEFNIPCPWGHIAAKTWGNENNPLVMTIHGWGDNASSFDTLIPLLPDCFYYFCFDLPSQGQSSHLELSLFLHDMDYILIIRYLYDYLKRDKIILLAHSLGVIMATGFAQYYPNAVSKLICLDTIYNFPRSMIQQRKYHKLLVSTKSRRMHKKNTVQPKYTKEEAILRFLSGRIVPMSRRAAEVLIDRNLKPVGDGKYFITIAQHVKQIIASNYTLRDNIEVIKHLPVKCSHLIIMSSSTSFMKYAFREFLIELRKNPNFEFHEVEGTHEVHIDNPELVAPIVERFLLKQSNKL